MIRLGLIILIVFGSFWIFNEGIKKNEYKECKNWEQQKETYPNWYALNWQIDQCKTYNIDLNENKELKVTASITKYAWTGNKMANGEWPHEGVVASSDRNIPFGTKVIIDGKEYTVKDRTAKWVHEKFGLTFDIYSEEGVGDMLNFGRQQKEVEIIYPVDK